VRCSTRSNSSKATRPTKARIHSAVQSISKAAPPLQLREKRRITYTLTARIAPSFTQQIPIREDRRTHGLAALGYQEVFDAFGGSRNLGLSVDLFNSETALGWFTSQRDIQTAATGRCISGITARATSTITAGKRTSPPRPTTA
jgi:hypothetical protein